MFRTRLISGAVILALTLLCVAAGGYVLFAYIAVLTLVGVWELYKAWGIEKSLPAAAGYVGVCLYELSLLLPIGNLPLMAVAVGVLLVMAAYVFTFPHYQAGQGFGAVAGIAYVAVLLSFIYLIRNMQDGLYLSFLVYICAWGNDTFAYLAGRAFGKHKMSPILSPKKSVEGFFGGIAGAALLGFIYGKVFQDSLASFGSPAIACLVIGAAGALLAVVGDLAASAIKRDTGIKDYGWIIPGHGGVLDRFDSILYTAPAVYILAAILPLFGH